MMDEFKQFTEVYVTLRSLHMDSSRLVYYVDGRGNIVDISTGFCLFESLSPAVLELAFKPLCTKQQADANLFLKDLLYNCDEANMLIIIELCKQLNNIHK